MGKPIAIVIVATTLLTVLPRISFAVLRCTDSRPCKVCSYSITNQFRDTFVVPKTWTKETCRAFGNAYGGLKWAVGCMKSNSIALGPEANTSGDDGDAVPPSPNCGW